MVNVGGTKVYQVNLYLRVATDVCNSVCVAETPKSVFFSFSRTEMYIYELLLVRLRSCTLLGKRGQLETRGGFAFCFLIFPPPIPQPTTESQTPLTRDAYSECCVQLTGRVRDTQLCVCSPEVTKPDRHYVTALLHLRQLFVS